MNRESPGFTRGECQFSIFRMSDWYECMSGYEDSAETVRDKIQQLKDRVDSELAEKDPWGEEDI